MKKYHILTVLMLIAATFYVSSCGSDPGPTPKAKNTKLLTAANPWMVSKVIADGTTVTSDFTGMTLTFTATTISTTNGGLLWSASDTWEFLASDKTAMKFTRGDGVEVTINTLTSTDLKLSFNWNGTLGTGRTKSVAGAYVFEFTK